MSTKFSVGRDLISIEDVVVRVGEQAVIKTGYYMKDVPANYFGLVKERSSIARKGGFCIGGVIDADYKDEIVVVMTSLFETFKINAGDRVAQLLLIPYLMRSVEEIDVLPDRNGGFGSTGK